jgi:3-dehydroquinate dehydratase / shikimate dehydrogenase
VTDRRLRIVINPLLCVTVTAPTTAELRKRRDAVTDADLVELRLDSVADPNVAAALAGRRRPVIVTCRPVWEGGLFAGSEADRHALLSDALALGAEYVDVEWRARFDDLVARTAGQRIVLSSHDFEGVPADLTARMQAMRATGAEVVKLAIKATRLVDCVALLELGNQPGQQRGLVLVGMGESGLATRVLAGRFGSRWTYAGTQAEVGQLDPDRLRDEYGFRSLSGSPDVYGLVGAPVDHSVSPAMHNAAFRAAHLDAVSLPFPAADADDFVTFARAMGLKGAGVTTPYKVALMERVDECDPIARRIGAINTIRVASGRWLGGNTDASGFLVPLGDRAALAGQRAAVLGAGGAARAVAVALVSAGSSVTVHARDVQRAMDVAMRVGAKAGAWPPARGQWDLLVNCTPVGMYPHAEESPMPADDLTGRTVYDLVYNPAMTRLLREARRAGCEIIGGLDMLVGQAREQFEWWTGVRPSAAVMREAAVKKLAQFAGEAGPPDRARIERP